MLLSRSRGSWPTPCVGLCPSQNPMGGWLVRGRFPRGLLRKAARKSPRAPAFLPSPRNPAQTPAACGLPSGGCRPWGRLGICSRLRRWADAGHGALRVSVLGCRLLVSWSLRVATRSLTGVALAQNSLNSPHCSRLPPVMVGHSGGHPKAGRPARYATFCPAPFPLFS
jgi:hypothetical protein